MEQDNHTSSFLYDTLLPKFEAISWTLALVGLIAKWNLLAVADYLLIVGLLNLSIVYMLKAFAPQALDKYEALSASNSNIHGEESGVEHLSFFSKYILPQSTAFGSAAIFVGTLFKLLSWEHATVVLIFAEVCLLIRLVHLALNQRWNRRFLYLAALGALMLYIPAETWIYQFHSDDPVLIRKMIYQLQHPQG